MRTYEVFLKKEGREEFRHAGAIEAPDPDMALVLARECYARRAEGTRMWVVDRASIHAADPGFITPNENKPHRHNDGALVAERRRAQRDRADREAGNG